MSEKRPKVVVERGERRSEWFQTLQRRGGKKKLEIKKKKKSLI